jgi:hypothetical protein
MKTRWLAAMALSGFVLTGCYRADIITGLTPSGEVIEDEWVVGFVGGLAMVDDVDAEDCTNGIARVMTRQSFLNVLVNVLTWGVVTPMEVRVECAAARSAATDGMQGLQARAGTEEVGEALHEAALRSAATGEAVYVRFTE